VPKRPSTLPARATVMPVAADRVRRDRRETALSDEVSSMVDMRLLKVSGMSADRDGDGRAGREAAVAIR
jgi:hypothetical protein